MPLLLPIFRSSMTPVAIESLPAKSRKEIEQFLKQHPLTPAGRLRPKIGLSGTMWFALFGPSVQDGKVGFGSTPIIALQAFNRSFGRTTRAGEEKSL